MTIDVMIPTLNEARHIPLAVANARLLGKVFVLDSISTDGTQEIARAAGATVIEHRFEGYASQKNWGLDNLPFTADWIFILDADERITPSLRQEIFKRISDSEAATGYFINRMLVIMGQPIRHGALYPSWNLRLFRRGHAHYEQRLVHEHMICDGPTRYLRGAELLHIRDETIRQYITKHIHYADLEAKEWVNRIYGRSHEANARLLFTQKLRWRQWLRRELWPRMPLRPFWRFIYQYIYRLGFLDGRAGWHLARLMTCYEYMIGLLFQQHLAAERQARRQAYAAAKQRALDPAQ